MASGLFRISKILFGIMVTTEDFGHSTSSLRMTQAAACQLPMAEYILLYNIYI